MKRKRCWPPLRDAHFCTWLKGMILEASCRKDGLTYYDVGYRVGCGISGFFGKWESEDVARAEEEFEREDTELIDWCRRWIPHILHYIPYRRRDKFLEGILQAYQDGEVQFEY